MAELSASWQPSSKKTLRRLNNIPASGKGMNAKARLIKFNGSSSDGARGETGGERQCNEGGGGRGDAMR